MGEENFLNITIKDGVAVMQLNRPPVNVLHIAMLREFDQALAELAADSLVRVLILSASGKMFSAGVDVADHTPEKVREMLPLFHRVCRALAEFPVPTLAAVHGHALGGGCELVLCCDLAAMETNAKIGQPEIQLAAIAPVAALRLPYFSSYRAAAQLMFTGSALSADEALSAGLVNVVVPPGESWDWAQTQAARIASLSRAAMVHLKSALVSGYQNWAAGLDDLENMYLEDLMQTADSREGLAAFLEKRPPVWSHR